MPTQGKGAAGCSGAGLRLQGAKTPSQTPKGLPHPATHGWGPGDVLFPGSAASGQGSGFRGHS